MKIGIFELKVTEGEKEYYAECMSQGCVLVVWGPYNTFKSAFAHGIEKLKEKVQELQDGLNKPRFRQKSKPVHVQQWWPCQKIDVVIKIGEIYWYHDQCIKPGDWIVDGRVVLNEQFEKDYEVIQ